MASRSRKLIYLFNWPLFFNLLLLLAIGLVNLYSATANPELKFSPYFKSQLIWCGIGLSLFFFLLTFHYRIFLNLAWPFYLITVLLLVMVVYFGTQMGGQQNWLVLGPVRMQPSEFGKVAVILMLARYFSKRDPEKKITFWTLIPATLIVFVPMGLILLEKDVGSAAFFVLIALTFYFLVGVPKRYLILALLLITFTGVVGYRHFLSDYQKNRIQAFLHPEKDPRGSGYHLLQSKIAVGSGRGLGTGYMAGHLNKLKFLPERHTDFIFPVLAEEWGFAGAGVTLLAFVSLFVMLLQSAGKVADPFGSQVIFGVTAWLFWQCAMNLGGVLGLLPLAGVTLPFLSYGGSALLTTFLGLGIAMNAYMRRYLF